MDGWEMAALLDGMGWSKSKLARRLDVHISSVSRWLSGQRPIPPNLAEWLHEVAEQLDKAPAQPRNWKDREASSV